MRREAVGRASSRALKKLAMEKRRFLAAKLYSTGIYREKDIAEQLSVSEPTISRDLAHCRSMWRVASAATIDGMLKDEMLKLNQLEATAVSSFITTGRTSDLVDKILDISGRRLKLLGIPICDNAEGE